MRFDLPRDQIFEIGGDRRSPRSRPAPVPGRVPMRPWGHNGFEEKAAKPALFDGEVVLLSELQFSQGRLSGLCHNGALFAVPLLAQSPPGRFPPSMPNAHPILVAADNALVAIRMAAHTFNAGQVYFASGSFEARRLSGWTRRCRPQHAPRGAGGRSGSTLTIAWPMPLAVWPFRAKRGRSSSAAISLSLTADRLVEAIHHHSEKWRRRRDRGRIDPAFARGFCRPMPRDRCRRWSSGIFRCRDGTRPERPQFEAGSRSLARFSVSMRAADWAMRARRLSSFHGGDADAADKRFGQVRVAARKVGHDHSGRLRPGWRR